MNLLAEIRARFSAALQSLADDPAAYLGMIKSSQDAKFGDYQANCAMPLGNRTGENPREVAARIMERLDLSDLCSPAEVAGPGFINVKLRDEWIESQANGLIADDRLGVGRTPRPRTVIVDYSAPNVAKPMHVGHLRSTVIGDALCRVLRFLGESVVGDNHIGDWGTQFGMIIYGYKHFLNADALAKDTLGELARLYRLVNQLCDYHAGLSDLPEIDTRRAERTAEIENLRRQHDAADKKTRKAVRKLESELASLNEKRNSLQQRRQTVEDNPDLAALAGAHSGIAAAARTETAKLHAGDAENRELWEQILPVCLAGLDRIYARLGISFDVTLGESYYQPMLADVVENLRAAGVAQESEGAICVFNSGYSAPFIVQKTDGAFTYASTDLATIGYRAKDLAADVALYVVDARQSEHFEQLFATARRWGYDAVDFRHVRFGTILDPETRTPYKTRSGGTVGLEGLLDEAVAEARAIVDANDDAKPDGPELDETTRAAVAETVGIGGLKYADLNHNRESDYAFDLKKMLAKEGDTATYMQYAYARVCGIFRKGGVDREELRSLGGRIVIGHPAERALALQICRLEETICDVVEDYRPNLLTQYLFDLANCFSRFFEDCHVLRAETPAAKTSRLLLCDLTGRTIQLGLSLLGIATCERM